MSEGSLQTSALKLHPSSKGTGSGAHAVLEKLISTVHPFWGPGPGESIYAKVGF